MPALSEYTNVYNTALNILDKKGYRVWYDEEIQGYCAEKDGWDFIGNTPCGLLGVIAIYEYKNPESFEINWWKDEEKDLYLNISKKEPEYTSVIYKK
ncbi:hypothetical protein [Xenorhabdus bovienii]|uniref:hypothetical protein n=1 Tax=Xenorhabdus bovienii TaxID=40576 RepID=UPI0023B28A6A|nr:hypothetical protein [Xenorhabdus bovienii]MDE9455918.1 hypothetical protein [Xenorhabdus bovienii]MDE9545256.1 hypothetical protein [Xenorhabdus bovienii]